MALGPKQMGEAIIRNLKAKTGKSVEEWADMLTEQKLSEKKEVVAFLKSEKGLGHFQARAVYEFISGSNPYEDPIDLVEGLFNTEASRTLYELAKVRIAALGADIRVQPCRTYIPFYRTKQFATLTKNKENQLILGLNFPSDQQAGTVFRKATTGSGRINVETLLASEADLTPEILDHILIAYNHN